MNLINFDIQFFKAIHSLAGQNIWLDNLAVFCAIYLIWIMIFVFVIWWLELARTKPSHNWPLLGKRKWLEGGTVALSVGLALLINQFLSLFNFRSRPFISADAKSLIDLPYSIKSFPSDHTAIVFALFLALYFYNKKIGICFFILAIMVGLARIFVGVHFPLDIIAGILVGTVSAILVRLLFIKVLYKKT